MDKREKIRWAVLLTALAGTIVAIFYPVDEPAQTWTPNVPKPGPAMQKVKAPAPELRDISRPVWIANDDDPFGPRVWEAPPPPLEASRAVQRVDLNQAAPEPPPPPPPPLPYRFLGQMQDGSDRIFYLGHGEQLILARQGEVLEGSYKVVAVNADMLEFESIQSGIRQTLPIPTQ